MGHTGAGIDADQGRLFVSGMDGPGIVAAVPRHADLAVSHTDSVEDLVRCGADAERLVLCRAVEAFCARRGAKHMWCAPLLH
ncbi:hypothetical protein ACFZDK_50845 [Streptomyces sp. NPDC007901]|uniref:hypothetical protein n=1 Tax=Streptomyces sp. NPDC007901 TaxID=3364785 RepID=UPI0036EA0DC7